MTASRPASALGGPLSRAGGAALSPNGLTFLLLSDERSMTMLEAVAQAGCLRRCRPRRAGPREVEYSGVWLDSSTEPPCWVAWLEATGELYALRLAEPGAGDELELLGHLSTRAEAEVALRGWGKVTAVQARWRVCDIGLPIPTPTRARPLCGSTAVDGVIVSSTRSGLAQPSWRRRRRTATPRWSR